jgi:hypothetical protein
MTSPAADSVAPPGYSGPLIEPIRRTEPEPQIEAKQEQALERRRNISNSGFPWRGALFAAAVVVGAAAVYVLFLGPKSDADRARQTISDYEHAVVASDGARACSLLTGAARMQVIALGLSHGIRGGCPAVLGVAGMGASSAVAQARAAGKGAQVDTLLSANGARVVVDPSHSYAAAMPYGSPILMARVGGQWMIDSLNGGHSRPKAAHVTGASHDFAVRADTICRATARSLEPLGPVVAKEIKAAMAGSAAPGLAPNLQTLTAKTNAQVAHLAALQPPAAQAATFGTYLAAERNDMVVAGQAAQLAQQGRTQDAALQTLLAIEVDDSDAPVSAQLGFHDC